MQFRCPRELPLILFDTPVATATTTARRILIAAKPRFVVDAAGAAKNNGFFRVVFHIQTYCGTMMKNRILGYLTVFAFLTTVSRFGLCQVKDEHLLSLERIFTKNEFASEGIDGRWLGDGSRYTTLEKSAEVTSGKDVVAYDALTGHREVLISAADLVPEGLTEPLTIDNYQWSDDLSQLLVYTNSRRVWRRKTRGDYWVVDRAAHVLRKLGGDAPPASMMFAKFSPDGRRVAYVRNRNIYVEDLLDHSIHAVTFDQEDSHLINGTFDWVYEEELRLRDGFRWSPDSRKIAYWQIDTSDVREFTLVNNTAGLYPRLTKLAYPKTGQTNPAFRIGIVDCANGRTQWITTPGNSRDHYLARMEWTEDGGGLVLQQLNRLQNENRVMLANANTGSPKVLLTERDDAWVDVHDEMLWFDGGKRFTWVSERDGWRHVYVGSLDDQTDVRLITPGDYDVIELLHVDAREECIYFIASPDDPTQRHLYKAPLDGGRADRLTPITQRGSHAYRVSPNGMWALHTWSTIDTPPVTELVELPSCKPVRVLDDARQLREKIEKLDRQAVEFFRVDIGNDVELDAWCIKPPKLVPRRKYPLLVFVYGEPAGTTVRDRWGGSGFLWHLMMAQRGYVVMSIDNRGTPQPRGRQWRKQIYRQVGVLAPMDQAAAVRSVLEDRPYLDADRVGVWGWSGGGSMSLNAIFKFPELYKTAIAIAPVANQRFYDTIYQERYMGLPGDNVDGFLEGSPINFAKNLRGNLLLVHGTGDDNCHYQATECLINELIRHNKPFDMMAYPNRSHSIREGHNTTRHLRELMTRYLNEHLPPGPRK